VKASEKLYSELKADPKKLAEFRHDMRAAAISGCTGTKQRRDFAGFGNRTLIEQAIDGAVTALETGQIEDGIPRLVLALLRTDPNTMWLNITWVESDFDTESVIVGDEAGGAIIEQNIFENHDLEKGYFFCYFRMCVIDTKPVSDIVDVTDRKIHVLLKYAGQNTPEFGPVFLFSAEGERAAVYVPEGEFSVWLRDKAGNESNHLPVVIVAEEMVRKLDDMETSYEFEMMMNRMRRQPPAE
jgi:hypothetical protein